MTRIVVGAWTMLLAASTVAAQPPFKKSGLKIGDSAPDFELTYLSENRTFKLSDNFGKKPTLLVFHSFT